MRERGYTLLEILVVVTIVAVVSGALMLSARGAGSDRQVEEEARRLTRVIELLCDAAVIEGRFSALGYGAHSYGGYRYENEGWRPVSERGPSEEHALPAGLLLRVPAATEELPPGMPQEPQILCAPTGDFGPVDLELAVAGSGDGWSIKQDDSGQIVLKALGAPL